MKNSLLIVLLAMAGFAHAAPNYRVMQNQRKECNFVAERAGISYKKTQDGLVETVPDSFKDDPMYNLAVWSVNYGKRATSLDDAVRMSLAKCYDNIERIWRDARDNVITPVDQYK